MQPQYQPQLDAQNWIQAWQESHAFSSSPSYDASSSTSTYCLMLPPPNVTGTLHMGHAFQQTLMDVLARHHRLMGDRVLWQGGTDHAGIATQLVVAQKLRAQGIDFKQLTREAFEAEVWAWKENSQARIEQQMQELGASVDPHRLRFTMDQDYIQAVTDAFIRLYDEGLIIQGERMVYWDPIVQTALSDLEVTHQEHAGHLWHICYVDSQNPSQSIIVATTRPETLFGDMAVAVHPDDPRYQSWIGKTVRLPICHRLIPVIADASVDQTFGSGCVKITPAHDFNDLIVSKKHGIHALNILNPDGTLNHEVPAPYQGLLCAQARTLLLEQLQKEGYLAQTTPHSSTIPINERSGAVLQPYLTPQWYLRMQSMAKKALDALYQGQIRFFPDTWSKNYIQWLENIEDWCISRQLWWGHRLPLWHDAQGQTYAGRDIHDVRTRYALDADVSLTQSSDVLDTWFSSALWPIATLGWPHPTPEFSAFYPTQTLITGFDIIFFWVARMVMLDLHLTGQVPFRDIYITGLIRDGEGKKMSKSVGNVIDFMDIIHGIDLESLVQKRTSGIEIKKNHRIEALTRQSFPNGIPAFGADALRLSFGLLISGGRDVRFDLDAIQTAQHICNKLWNAARYVLSQTTDLSDDDRLCLFHEPKPKHPINRWMIDVLHQTAVSLHTYLTSYRFDWWSQALRDVLWQQFCDRYVEYSKVLLQGGELKAQTQTDLQKETKHVLMYAFSVITQWFHPITPLITETITRDVLKRPMLATDRYLMRPCASSIIVTEEILETRRDFQALDAHISAIRQLKAKHPGVCRTLYWHSNQPEYAQCFIEQHMSFLTKLTRTIEFLPIDSHLSRSTLTSCEVAADAPHGNITWLMSTQSAKPSLDPCEAKNQKEKIQKSIDALTNKLSNPYYVSRSPEETVRKTRLELDVLKKKLHDLQQDKNEHDQEKQT